MKGINMSISDYCREGGNVSETGPRLLDNGNAGKMTSVQYQYQYQFKRKRLKLAIFPAPSLGGTTEL